MPLPLPEPLTLTVTPRGRVYLSQPLAVHLGLRQGQALELFPPTARRRGAWHLFLPDTPDAPLPKLTLYTGKRYNAHFDCRMTLSPTRFRRYHSGKNSGKGGSWHEQLPILTLELAADTLSSSGFLSLKPLYFDAQPTQSQAPQIHFHH